jgi:hypothetical protein
MMPMIKASTPSSAKESMVRFVVMGGRGLWSDVGYERSSRHSLCYSTRHTPGWDVWQDKATGSSGGPGPPCRCPILREESLCVE